MFASWALLIPTLAASTPVQHAPSPAGESASALCALRTRAGWRDLLAPVARNPWGAAREGTFEYEPFLLRRTTAAGADLTLEVGSDSFELEYEWRAAAEPPTPWSRVYLRVEGASVEQWEDGERTLPRAPGAADAGRSAPIRVHAGPMRLSVPGAGPPAELRRMHLRDLARLPGGPIALVSADTLEGWIPSGDAQWSVDDGALRGRVGGGAQSFLRSTRTFGDFVLELEFRLHGAGNSGVQVRSRVKEDGRVSGYQIEIDPSPRAWTGGLYDEARRGWLQNLAALPAARAALDPHGWNRLRVECLGPWIRSWVNGVPAADHFDPLDLEGFLALQVHSGTDTDLTWRDLRLWDLGRRAWEVLEPSDLLERWVQTGEWRRLGDPPVGGTLVGRPGATLGTPGPMHDFALRFELRSHGGAGLRLRFRTTDDSPLELREQAPSLASSAGGWTLHASDPSLAVHADGWTRIALAVFGERVVLHAGDRLVADLRDASIPRTGWLAFEVTGESGQAELRRLRFLGPPR